jgi:hypothetical protein
LGAVNSGNTFINGLALWPFAALVLFPGNIKITRSVALQAKTKWLVAEYGLFISTVLFPDHTCPLERGSTARSLIILH